MNSTIFDKVAKINKGNNLEGYTKNIIGVMPDDWSVVPLADVLKKQTATNDDNSIHNVLTNSATKGIVSQTDYFDKQIANNDNTDLYYIVKPGYFVYNPRISVTAPCGPFNRYNGVSDGIMSPLYSVYVLKNDSGFDTDYLAHYFLSSHWYAYMNSVANYGARSDRMNITSDDMNAMPLPLPPLPEQRKIAAILSTQDKVIELKSSLLDEKLRQKKYLAQILLSGKKRLKGFENTWSTVQLGSIGVFYNGLSGKKADDFGDGNSYYITFLNVLNNVVINVDGLGKVKIAADEKQHAVKKGDLFFNTSSETPEEVGMCAVLLDELHNTYLNSFCFGFRLTCSNINPLYLSYYFNSDIGRSTMFTLAQGATRYNLSKSSFAVTSIRIPSLNEQDNILSILSTADREIELLRQELELEKQKKKALMQLLLTGKVRVTTDE